MIDLANIAFSITASPIGESALAQQAAAMFDRWDERASALLPVDDYSIYLELTEGSINGKGKIAAALAAVYVGIGNFADFAGGVREIANLGRGASSFLVEEARARFGTDDHALAVSRRNAGQLGQLERLFAKVQTGELNVDEATRQARSIFEEEEQIPAGFWERLSGAIRSVPRDATQIELPFEETTISLPITSVEPTERKRQQRPRQDPPLPPPNLYRVEIVRESKASRRRIRIEKV